jgi:hypothetical protein
MNRKDYVILFILVLVSFVSVFVITSVVEASLLLQSEGQSGIGMADDVYPGPYPMNYFEGPKLLPLIFQTGQ